jgi:hypothetical protein
VLSEKLQLQFVPVLHRLQGRLAAQGWLRELLVGEPDGAVLHRFQILARRGGVLLHLLDPAVEALDHAVGCGRLGQVERCLMSGSSKSLSNSCVPAALGSELGMNTADRRGEF